MWIPVLEGHKGNVYETAYLEYCSLLKNMDKLNVIQPQQGEASLLTLGKCHIKFRKTL